MKTFLTQNKKLLWQGLPNYLISPRDLQKLHSLLTATVVGKTTNHKRGPQDEVVESRTDDAATTTAATTTATTATATTAAAQYG